MRNARVNERESNVAEEMGARARRCRHCHRLSVARKFKSMNNIKYCVVNFDLFARVHHFIMIDVPVRTSRVPFVFDWRNTCTNTGDTGECKKKKKEFVDFGFADER